MEFNYLRVQPDKVKANSAIDYINPADIVSIEVF
jgi:hypothetical protein